MKVNQLFQKMLICMILIGSTNLIAQDWPQWRGPNRDGKVEGFTAPQEWPEKLTPQWRKEALGMGCSTPALVGDKLYVFVRQAEDEVILCLNADTGEELWRDAYPAQRPTGGPGQFPGPRCSCTVADDKLVTLGVGGILSCMDTQTGKLVWRKDPFPKIVPMFFTSASPIVVDKMVIAHLGGKDNGAIIAYDLATGEEKWRWDGSGPEYASPVLCTLGGTEQIVTLAEKNIVGVGVADGKLLWQYPFAPENRAYNSVTPIVNGDTVIISGAKRGTRALKITKQDDVFSTSEVWNNPDIACQYNTPILTNDLLFGVTDRNKLFCIDAKTGQATWTDDTTRGSRGYGAIVNADSCLFFLTSDSELIAFKPDGKAYSEIADYKFGKAATIAHPIISGKRIYIKDKESLAMWSIE